LSKCTGYSWSDTDPFSPKFEKACIAKTGALATRRGGELRLMLGNGAVKLYRDSRRECEKGLNDTCKNYTLYDYFPEHRLVLVHLMHYESDEWFLVRQQVRWMSNLLREE
jgi:hypothetical protein